MREYNEIMLRPVLYPGGQVQAHPEDGFRNAKAVRPPKAIRQHRRGFVMLALGMVMGLVLAVGLVP
jgi:23S rRNA A2030 N6-methylase RlmJ